MHDLEQNPQIAAIALISAAPTDELMQFVGNAIVRYFRRIIRADGKKLAQFGLRPVISPAAADEALRRVEYVEYSSAWLHALVANDPEVARLALRAVGFYAKRFADAHLEQVSAEAGEAAMQVKAAAEILNVTLDLTAFELQEMKNP